MGKYQCLVGPYLEYCAQFLLPMFKKGEFRLKRMQRIGIQNGELI